MVADSLFFRLVFLCGKLIRAAVCRRFFSPARGYGYVSDKVNNDNPQSSLEDRSFRTTIPDIFSNQCIQGRGGGEIKMISWPEVSSKDGGNFCVG